MSQEMELRNLEKELKEWIEKAEIAKKDLVVIVEARTSEGYYDYHLHSIFVRQFSIPHEDSGGVETKVITAGVFQEYSIYDVEELLQKLGFFKVYQA
ncbi:hypothetical protein DRJ17_07100 [Candidatus Woesearchaeota archaeon]|nr:MAG: hypothetical protein DRJ17_07100 [Candidatus Woesearchaeota archaeon]